jgi:hypothetical protein
MLVLASSVCLARSVRSFSAHMPHKPSFIVSTESIKGRRSYMEDEYHVSNDSRFVAVYDGTYSF